MTYNLDINRLHAYEWKDECILNTIDVRCDVGTDVVDDLCARITSEMVNASHVAQIRHTDGIDAVICYGSKIHMNS